MTTQDTDTARPDFNPLYCDHKDARGYGAWSFASERTCAGDHFGKVVICVCRRCGDINITGYMDDNKFNETFAINHPEHVGYIVNQCNFINNREVFVEGERFEKLRQENTRLLKVLQEIASIKLPAKDYAECMIKVLTIATDAIRESNITHHE